MTRSRESGTTASPPWRPAEAPTLPALIQRRAEAEPEGLYFTLFGTPLTAGRLHATTLRYARGAARARPRTRRQGGDHPPDVRGVLLHLLRHPRDRRRARAPLPHPRPRAEGPGPPELRGPGGRHDRLVPGRRRGRARRGAGRPAPPDAGRARDRERRGRARARHRGRDLLPPVHLRQHLRATRRRAEPPERDGDRPDDGRGRGGDADRPAGELAAPLSRHGAHRARLRGALHGREPRAPPAGPQGSPRVARGDHPAPRPPHGVPGFRLPELSPAHPRHHRPRPLEPPDGAVGGGAGATVDDPRVPGALRRGRHLRAGVRAGRGDAGGGRLAARAAGARRSDGALRLGGTALPGGAGRDRRGRRRRARATRRGGRDPGPEPGGDAGLLPRSRGHRPRPPRRVAPHRRPRLPRRRGIPLHHGAHQGRDHRARAERRPRRHRGGRRPRRRRPVRGRHRDRERAHGHPASPRGRGGAGGRADSRGALPHRPRRDAGRPPAERAQARARPPRPAADDPQDVERQDPARRARRHGRRGTRGGPHPPPHRGHRSRAGRGRPTGH